MLAEQNSNSSAGPKLQHQSLTFTSTPFFHTPLPHRSGPSVTRQGVVLTDLQPLVDCQYNQYNPNPPFSFSSPLPAHTTTAERSSVLMAQDACRCMHMRAPILCQIFRVYPAPYRRWQVLTVHLLVTLTSCKRTHSIAREHIL